MRAKWILVLAAGLQMVFITGCVPTVDGRRAVGMPFTKDTIEARYERSPMEIWKVAKEVIAYNGQLYSEDVLKSTLEGTVNLRTVWVRVEPLDDRVTRVIVQSRSKGGAADLEMAGEIDKQIALKLQANGSGGIIPRTTAAGRP